MWVIMSRGDFVHFFICSKDLIEIHMYFCIVCRCIVQNVNFALSGNGKESFNRVLDPDVYPDHHQNLVSFKLGQI